MLRISMGFLFLICNLVFAETLELEIKNWKVGTEPPHRLLSYPDGKVEPLDSNLCGISESFNSVYFYISSIENYALLEEVIFDPRTSGESFNSAFHQLVEIKGLQWTAAKFESRESSLSKIEMLRQIFQSRFVKLSVAFISSKEMKRSKAINSLKYFQSLLGKGTSWHDAYRIVADENPDVERRKLEPKIDTTLVTYLFDGWVSASGFQVNNLQFTKYISKPLLRRVVNSEKGTILIEDEEDGIYLFYVSDIYMPKS